MTSTDERVINDAVVPLERLPAEQTVHINHRDAVPMDIAIQHARMAACAMRTGDEAKAVAAVRRAFRVAREMSQWRVTLDSPIAELGMSIRIVNLLESLGITTVNDITRTMACELLAVPGVNRRTVSNIENALSDHGLSLHR